MTETEHLAKLEQQNAELLAEREAVRALAAEFRKRETTCREAPLTRSSLIETDIWADAADEVEKVLRRAEDA